MQAVQPSVLLAALVVTLIPTELALADDGQADHSQLLHETCPEQDCRPSVVRFLEAFRSEDKNHLANLIDFPVYRGYPIVAPIERHDFVARFDDLFDEELTQFIIASDLENWSVGGWRGIMLRGPNEVYVWLHHDGSLRGVYGGWRAEWIAEWNRLIELERSQLHTSLHEYARPILEWETEHYRIRIDSLAGGGYRYAAWRAGANHRRKPDLILDNGKVFGHGGCGNHQYEFTSGDYLYQVRVHSCPGSTAPGELIVYRNPGHPATHSHGELPPQDYELLRQEPFIKTPITLEELAISVRRRTD